MYTAYKEQHPQLARHAGQRIPQIRRWMAQGVIAESEFVERCLQVAEGSAPVALQDARTWSHWQHIVLLLHSAGFGEAREESKLGVLWPGRLPDDAWITISEIEDWGVFLRTIEAEFERVSNETVRQQAKLEVGFKVGVPQLVVLGGEDTGRVFDLDYDKQLTLGRGPDCDLVLPDEAVSRVHAVISLSLDGLTYRDALSTNGTFSPHGEADELMLTNGGAVVLSSSVVLAFSDGTTERDALIQMAFKELKSQSAVVH